jgi:hypothetical protein
LNDAATSAFLDELSPTRNPKWSLIGMPFEAAALSRALAGDLPVCRTWRGSSPTLWPFGYARATNDIFS